MTLMSARDATRPLVNQRDRFAGEHLRADTAGGLMRPAR